MILLILIVSTILSFTSAHCYDTLHFYRATPLFQKPRFERSWLTSFDVTFRGGVGTSGLNKDRDKVPLCDIFGTHNMKDLGAGVPRPDNDVNNPLDMILTDLEMLPGRDNFATLSIDGDFALFELYIHLVHNFCYGFFIEGHIPIRSIRVSKQPFTDLTPDDEIEPNKNSQTWQRFLQDFNAILKRYDLSRDKFDETGAGDTTVLFGWTHNYQETETLDFVDITLAAGFIAPTGKKQNIDNIFALPFGYDKHWGIPIQARLAIGLYDWLTFGTYASGIFFTNNSTKKRIKTAQNQSGIIKLAKASVTIDKGSLFHAGGYIEADHCVRGLSFLIGYSFASGQNETYCPREPDKFNPTIINSDEMLQGWSMHTIHLFAGYDFANERSWCAPRIGLYYDHIVRGKRVFKTNMIGANIGIEALWKF